MKPIKSKAQERREIENQVNEFLQHGGKVNAIASGISGRELGSYRLPPVSFHEKKESRTPLLDEVRAIEARKAKPHTLTPPRPKGPRKVLVTDDFGEPLRWRWQDS